jgi:hypothetical protein
MEQEWIDFAAAKIDKIRLFDQLSYQISIMALFENFSDVDIMEVFMPITYQIDVARRVVFTRGYGTVTDEDLLQHNAELKADPNFDPTFNQLLNFTEVMEGNVKSETINRIARNRIFNVSSLRAIVVKPGFQFGLARMFQNIRVYEDKNIQVFLDIKEALGWLGLDE